ncbi:hypothetical protein NDU88_005570 [Pleurodeles waltl]|uniref:Uncharacterized protein n=1 Tax=Pleurodeles waltl TaxID=8319 RepID=A0AAV7RPK7_PLEWA|nr:hypothetical protein NDU88_005570 [Pleurodeles waltl]
MCVVFLTPFGAVNVPDVRTTYGEVGEPQKQCLQSQQGRVSTGGRKAAEESGSLVKGVKAGKRIVETTRDDESVVKWQMLGEAASTSRKVPGGHQKKIGGLPGLNLEENTVLSGGRGPSATKKAAWGQRQTKTHHL